MPSLTDSESETDTDEITGNTEKSSTVDLPPIPKVIPKCDEEPPYVNCSHHSCAYFEGYETGHDYKTHKNLDISLYTCALCKCLYVCEHCQKCGAHKGHTAWMRLMPKGPDDKVHVKWHVEFLLSMF